MASFQQAAKLFLKESVSNFSFSKLKVAQDEEKYLHVKPIESNYSLTVDDPPVPFTKGNVKLVSTSMRQDCVDEKIKNYLSISVRDSTRNTYSRHWKNFIEYCGSQNFSLSSKAVSAYLIHLAERSEGKASSLIARSAIKYFFKINNPAKKCPTDTWLVSRISASIKKKFGKPVKKAKCLEAPVVKCLVLKLLSGNNPTLKDLRFAAFLLLMYFIFGRYDDIKNLKISELMFLDSGDLKVKVSNAKNFENWDAQNSSIADNPGSKVNTVSIVKDYCKSLALHGHSDGLLFPSFRHTKKGLVMLKHPLSYDAALKEFRSILSSCGYDAKLYSLHSPKNGAVSRAANSGVCSNEQLKRHGRWKGSSMPDYYSKQSLKNKLHVSKVLKID